MVFHRKPGAAGENPATFDSNSYAVWRDRELQQQFEAHFSPADVKGCDVLDFGCGEGGLACYLADRGVRSITGVDLDEKNLGSAIRLAAGKPLKCRPEFRLASAADVIDCPDASLDVILCFDVLEHIMSYREIIPEWHRVLRPSGRVLIWWVPWFNPYGPHIESLVPLPWAHVFFSDRTLIRTCARMYDLPEFKPRKWDLDDNGVKRPNKWRALDRLPGVNRLTIGTFEKLSRRAGFTIEKREIFGFGSSSAARLTHAFTHLPVLREFFCSRIVYTLRKS